jgi:hypothetical protein
MRGHFLYCNTQSSQICRDLSTNSKHPSRSVDHSWSQVNLTCQSLLAKPTVHFETLSSSQLIATDSTSMSSASSGTRIQTRTWLIHGPTWKWVSRHFLGTREPRWPRRAGQEEPCHRAALPYCWLARPDSAEEHLKKERRKKNVESIE